MDELSESHEADGCGQRFRGRSHGLCRRDGRAEEEGGRDAGSGPQGRWSADDGRRAGADREAWKAVVAASELRQSN